MKLPTTGSPLLGSSWARKQQHKGPRGGCRRGNTPGKKEKKHRRMGGGWTEQKRGKKEGGGWGKGAVNAGQQNKKGGPGATAERQGPGHLGPGSTERWRQRGRERGGGKKGETKRKKKRKTPEARATPACRGPNRAKRQNGHRARSGAPQRAREAGLPDPAKKSTHTHTRGTQAWRPPIQKGRCRRPHETAPVHRPSPPSKDGRYGKPDASVTGSISAKQPQRTQPRTEA